jgi:hypothetical protein
MPRFPFCESWAVILTRAGLVPLRKPRALYCGLQKRSETMKARSPPRLFKRLLRSGKALEDEAIHLALILRRDDRVGIETVRGVLFPRGNASVDFSREVDHHFVRQTPNARFSTQKARPARVHASRKRADSPIPVATIRRIFPPTNLRRRQRCPRRGLITRSLLPLASPPPIQRAPNAPTSAHPFKWRRLREPVRPPHPERPERGRDR